MKRIGQKLYSWASIIEPATQAQAETTAQLPIVQPHVALMPDAHLGLGATVGSVIPTSGAVIPAAVGVDIGCGMTALATGVKGAALPSDRRALRLAIEAAIPASAGGYNKALTPGAQRAIRQLEAIAGGVFPDSHSANWREQVGTLGGGNHFIEVCQDQYDAAWLFLHSGSRGIGNRIAQHHIKVAQRQCQQSGVRLPDRDLAYLTQGTTEFDQYLRDLRWAQRFAALNRAEMLDRVMAVFTEWSGQALPKAERAISCHHNYTEQESHFGDSVWITRKGAIDAHAGVWGLIPGSMGTASYVVQGKGNPMRCIRHLTAPAGSCRGAKPAGRSPRRTSERQ